MEQGVVNGHNGVVDHLLNSPNGLMNGDLETSEANGVLMSGDGNSVVDIRIKKKAKRQIKQFIKETVSNGHGASVVVPPRNWKNTRRPRNGYGRGLPKKGKNKKQSFLIRVLRVVFSNFPRAGTRVPLFKASLYLLLFV